MAGSGLAPYEGERRMLIDGQLVEASTGKTFDNINPATEEVLGDVADADAADMRRAIAAARRAFDETSWKTDHAFRARCLIQLQDAIQGELEQFRSELVAEVGTPVMVTSIASFARASPRRQGDPVADTIPRATETRFL